MNSEVQQTKAAQYGEPRLTNVFMSAIAIGISFRYAVQNNGVQYEFAGSL